MKNNMPMLMAIIVLSVLSFAACSGKENNAQTFLVGPELRECVGEAPMMCMMVKRETDDDFLFFYDHINGFDYEEGFEYKLLVQIDEVENPPMGGSSLNYTLVEVISKTAVE